ncbi:MAG: 50S ribosomal protein L11 methyltransferase [Oscillospiraceae bacterium]|nr:50S ribosomal protein L11 methyltransferase [Oscillospiraceae bacterium]
MDDELNDRFRGLSRIKFYLSDDEEGKALLAKIRAELNIEIDCATVDDSDWENNWREFYKPLKIGEKFLVIPEWENPELEGRVALRLDPGLIFGTGSHATTRMCLHRLENFAEAGKKVLDLGCGSGILGIGAAVLGCDKVVGCDIDPKAPDVAADNAALNGIGEDRFKVYAGDILSDEGMRKFLGEGYDIVLANIVSDVIIPLSAFVRRFMGENAVFICSGIIDGREKEVRAALEANGFEIMEHCHEEEWNCYVCK